LTNATIEAPTWPSEETEIASPTLAEKRSENPFDPSTSSKKNIKWPSFLFIASMHVGALASFFTFNWQAFLLCIVLHWVTGGLGITLCFHRLLTHRSFKVPKFLEYFLAVLGSLACQAGPISWVAAHRLHHAKSDEEGDPHSPLKGFFWAHMGWCLTQNKTIDDYNEYSKLAPDLAKDPVYVFLDKIHIAWTFLLGMALYAWGGWPFVVWGIFVRTTLVYHSTWLVNSATHLWGYQTYRTGDRSTNLWWVALLSYGEGWHNNHHAFQSSARHGLQWWEIDTTYVMIKLLKLLGLATGLKIPSKRLLAEKINT
jgi:stearoyl-CoA desaturase (delta-9 desaturase)